MTQFQDPGALTFVERLQETFAQLGDVIPAMLGALVIRFAGYLLAKLIEQGTERLGRRVFTAIVIAALIVAAAVLLGSGQAVVGWGMLAVAAGWGFLHSVSMALTRNRPPRS